MTEPYRTTLAFSAETLPAALRREHSTKEGVWGIIRVTEGRLLLHFADRPTQELCPDTPGIIAPQEVHWVEPVGEMVMHVEFYSEEPTLTRS